MPCSSVTKKQLCEVLHDCCSSADSFLVNDLQLLTPHFYDDGDSDGNDVPLSESALELLTNLIKSILSSKAMRIRLKKKRQATEPQPENKHATPSPTSTSSPPSTTHPP